MTDSCLALTYPGVVGIEANPREYVPAANEPWTKKFPGICGINVRLCNALKLPLLHQFGAGTGSLKLAKTVRRAVAKVDANQPVVDIKTMDQRVMDSVSVRRLGLLPVLIFAVINAVTSDEASMDL